VSRDFSRKYPNHVILTALEIQKGNIMEDLKKHLGPPSPVEKTYTNIVNLLLASIHSGKANATINLAPYNLVEKSKKLLLGDNVGAIGGSLTSMLFWSQDQVTFLSDDHPRTVVCGQFGCGKTLIVLEKMRRYLRRVEKMSVEKPRALFISCLKPSLVNSRDESGKYIEPIFDSSIRVALDEMAKTEGCEIHFHNAESVCNKNVDLSWSNFYSNIPKFIKGKVSQFQM